MISYLSKRRAEKFEVFLDKLVSQLSISWNFFTVTWPCSSASQGLSDTA